MHAVVKHLKRLGDQNIPSLRVDLLAQFEMTRHCDPVFGNVPMVDASDVKTLVQFRLCDVFIDCCVFCEEFLCVSSKN